MSGFLRKVKRNLRNFCGDYLKFPHLFNPFNLIAYCGGLLELKVFGVFQHLLFKGLNKLLSLRRHQHVVRFFQHFNGACSGVIRFKSGYISKMND